MQVEDLSGPNPIVNLKWALKELEASKNNMFDLNDVFLGGLLDMVMQSEAPKKQNRKTK